MACSRNTGRLERLLVDEEKVLEVEISEVAGDQIVRELYKRIRVKKKIKLSVLRSYIS